MNFWGEFQKHRVILFFLAFFTASIAIAGPSGIYVGGQALYADYDEDSSGISFSDNAVGIKLYGGYRFGGNNSILDHFAIEASWQDYDDLEDDILGLDVEVGIDGYTVDALGYIPINDTTEFFGKVGYFDFDGDVDVEGIDLGSEDEDGINFGAGVAFHFDNISVRSEFTWFDVDDADFWTIGLGAQFSFGN